MDTEMNTSLHKQEILVNEIVFCGRMSVSLLGFVHLGGKYTETEYVISRNDLKELLSQNGKMGRQLLRHIEQLFVQPHAEPATVNLIELFGTTQELKAAEITLEIPVYEDENGELVPKTTYELLFVEEVITAPGSRPDYLTA